MKIMAKANVSFGFLCLLLSIVVCSSSRYTTTWAGEKRNVARTWCVANPFVGDDKLRRAIDYYCKQPGVDCNVIRPGGPCYQPNSVQEHASVVLNLYYKAHYARLPYCPADVGATSPDRIPSADIHTVDKT
ncbi:hypothetical protein RHGRI_031985 [Rhododendron griersonianum]|uniref:X8 domain-containing protein n=1 Tax=Rhododendron griersonianum TaxID=479676 RepID=A0AAV6IES2_9ERIC|nr:hypothetical protein RHGRI_031985 [Rhododendron griersonianum]